MSILDFFPHNEFRPGQRETILKIKQLFDSGIENIMVEMPTGGGKSSIAFTVAAYYQSAFTVTPQKMLQDQYNRDVEELNIPGTVSFKGKGNYPCLLMEGKDCEACIVPAGKPCEYKDTCHYYLARDKAIKSKNTIVNYHVLHNLDKFLFQAVGRDIEEYNTTVKRAVLICDEAHTIEGFLMDQVSVKIPTPDWKKETPFIKSALRTVVEKEHQRIVSEIFSLEGRIERMTEDDPFLPDRIKKLNALNRTKDKYVYLISKFDSDNWAFVQYDDKFGKFMGYEAKPIFVGQFSNMVLRPGKLKLFLSATLPHEKVFCRSLGLRVNETAKITTGTTFPVQNRQVYYLTDRHYTPITRKNTIKHGENNIYNPLLKVINTIIRWGHLQESKGLIITHSNYIMNKIVNSIPNDRFIRCSGAVEGPGDTRMKAIKDHAKTTQPKILIGPNLYEGLDLKHDKGRFCIIIKCPYPVEDAQIKARREKDNDWYNNMIALKLVQGLGRCCRAEDDHCMNFIIDPAIINFMTGRGHKFIPDYTKEALKPMPQCFT